MTHVRGLMAHNHVYTGNVCLVASPDSSVCASCCCYFVAAHVCNTIDADDKTNVVVVVEGALTDATIVCHVVVHYEDTVVSGAVFFDTELCVIVITGLTTVTRECSTWSGYVHVVEGYASPVTELPVVHGWSLGCLTKETAVGVCAEAVFHKCYLGDPASRKFLLLESLGRDLLRGCGWFGRYTERLVTTEIYSGCMTDTYVGGNDSAPLYYENETV